jgi:hypothetical protein
VSSIYKHEQRDDRYFLSWLGGIFLRQRCRSYLGNYFGQRLDCEQRRGHAGKHSALDVRWGYGDNWLEGN